jgi:hypothetical protein
MILDYLFITGQAASAMLLLYGALLALMPARQTQHTLRENDALFLERQAHGAD